MNRIKNNIQAYGNIFIQICKIYVIVHNIRGMQGGIAKISPCHRKIWKYLLSAELGLPSGVIKFLGYFANISVIFFGNFREFSALIIINNWIQLNLSKLTSIQLN